MDSVLHTGRWYGRLPRIISEYVADGYLHGKSINNSSVRIAFRFARHHQSIRAALVALLPPVLLALICLSVKGMLACVELPAVLSCVFLPQRCSFVCCCFVFRQPPFAPHTLDELSNALLAQPRDENARLERVAAPRHMWKRPRSDDCSSVG